jgi:hypothetical protein
LVLASCRHHGSEQHEEQDDLQPRYGIERLVEGRHVGGCEPAGHGQEKHADIERKQIERSPFEVSPAVLDRRLA